MVVLGIGEEGVHEVILYEIVEACEEAVVLLVVVGLRVLGRGRAVVAEVKAEGVDTEIH